MKRLHQWHIPVLVATVFLSYQNALDCNFVYDDFSAVVSNKDILPDTPLSEVFRHDFWGTPMSEERSHKSYRPLCILSFRLNYMWSELNPWAYHLTNVVLHMIATLLFYRMCSTLVRSTGAEETTISISFLSAALFAVHPIHCEAVTGIVGRAELLCNISMILAFLQYVSCCRRGTDWLGMCCCSLLILIATFCKEQGITIAGCLVAYDYFIEMKMNISDLSRITRWPRSLLMDQSCFSNGMMPSYNASVTATAAGIRERKHRMHKKVAATKQRLGKLSLNSAQDSDSPRNLQSFWTRMGILLVASLIVLGLRFYIMGPQLPTFSRFDNPAAFRNLLTRQLTWSYLAAFNGWLLLCPLHLSCDWSMGSIPLVESLTDWRNMATLCFLATIATVTRWCVTGSSATSRIGIVALSFLVFPFLPASNLFFPVGFVVAERVLYAPSMGFCLLLAIAWTRLTTAIHQRGWILERIAQACFFLAIIFLGFRTSIRNKDWKDELTIFEADLKVTPTNAKLYSNIGHIYEAEGNFTVALDYFKQAISLEPSDIESMISVGRMYDKLNDTELSEKALRLSLQLLYNPQNGAGPAQRETRVSPGSLMAFIHLGRLMSRKPGGLKVAVDLYSQAISMRSDFTQAYMSKGEALVKLGQPQKALDQYRKALECGREVDRADMVHNMGVAYVELGQYREALECFDEVLNMEPKHKLSLYSSALLIQDKTMATLYPLAMARLKILVDLDPHDADVYFVLALLSTDMENYEEAIDFFKQSVQCRPGFCSALFNLGLVLVNNVYRPLEALSYLESCVTDSFFTHLKCLLLLGDLNMNIMRDLDAAERNFQHVLKQDEYNTLAQHQVCVIDARRGHLRTAEECFYRILQLDPHYQPTIDSLEEIRRLV